MINDGDAEESFWVGQGCDFPWVTGKAVIRLSVNIDGPALVVAVGDALIEALLNRGCGRDVLVDTAKEAVAVGREGRP